MGGAEPCAMCGEPSVDGHHLTCRGANERYLDPALVAHLCHDCHELIGDDLRQEGLAKPIACASVFEKAAYRLECTAVFLARVAEYLGFAWLDRLARSMRLWAAELRRGVQLLDAHLRAWRQIPGMT
jgi:hypothetical protein